MNKNYNSEKVFEIISGWFDENREALIALSNRIWNLAEVGYKETLSAEALTNELKSRGFTVKLGLKNLPTAFVAQWCNGTGPVISFLGEYDALPNMGYEIADAPKPTGKNGHACGHNLLGAGTLSAAAAAKEVMEKLNIKGTLRYYGCPAEECCAAKAEMAANGDFDGTDAVLRWHPQNFTYVSMASTLRLNELRFRFRGISAHAQTQPHLGRSALDAVILTDIAVKYMRELIPDNHIRISRAITNGGGQLPTVIAGYAEIFYAVSAASREDSQNVINRMIKIAKGIAMATETEVEIVYGAACSEVLPNKAISECMLENLKKVGAPKWTEEEKAFAAKLDEDTSPIDKARTMAIYNITDPRVLETPLYEGISENMIENGIGLFSTDSADPSWVAPMGSLFAACAPVGSSVHSWPFTVCSGMSIGHKAMEVAGKTLALTAVNLIANENVLKNAKAEHKRLLAARPYINPQNLVFES